jgi:hypothetical protein
VRQKDGFSARANGGESAAEGMHFWPAGKAQNVTSPKFFENFQI